MGNIGGGDFMTWFMTWVWFLYVVEIEKDKFLDGFPNWINDYNTTVIWVNEPGKKEEHLRDKP